MAFPWLRRLPSGSYCYAAALGQHQVGSEQVEELLEVWGVGPSQLKDYIHASTSM